MAQSRKAQVVRRDAHIDLALLSADGLDAPPARFANDEPKAGAAVIAVGNPLGFVGAVSTGFVQAVGTLRGLGWRRWVQADVRLAPGNSGGPLGDVLRADCGYQYDGRGWPGAGHSSR